MLLFQALILIALDSSIARHTQSLVAVRRHLHRYPELSGQEYETTKFLASELQKSGIEFKFGPDRRGLIVDLGNPDAKHRLAIRADIDAIAVSDSKQVEYKSTTPEAMHACGHDAHSTILLGTVNVLNEYLANNQCDHAIRAIFQPEEEVATGAQKMIDFGALEDVSAIIAGHVDPTRRVGEIGLREGVMTAHCTEIFVDIVGRGGHAARPYECIDPVEIGMRFINECYTAIPRYGKESENVVLSFTAIHGGKYSNVIPENLQISGTMRSLQTDARQQAIEAIKNIAGQISTETGARINVSFGLIVPSMVAEKQMTNFVRDVSANILGQENVKTIEQPSMGGEDFAFYSQQRPATFVRLGCRGNGTGNLPLHNSGFDIDEGVLEVGVKIMVGSAIEFLQNPIV